MIKSQRLSFDGALGEPLAARLDRPASSEPRAYALFAHCFTCSKDLKAVTRISRSLVERGFAVLRFDFTGLGESDGDFADTNFSSNLQDLLAAVEFLRQNHRAPQLMIGHSLGGAAVLVAAPEVPECRAVATLGAPSETQHLREGLAAAAPELEQDSGQDTAQVTLGGRPFRIRRQLLDDLAEERVLAAVRHLNRPVLVMHSPTDDVVSIDHARRIYDAAKHPRSFISLDGADHLLLSDSADAEYVGQVLSAWAGRYLETEAEVAVEADTEAVSEAVAVAVAEATEPPPKGVTRVRSLGGLAQEVTTGRHRLLAGEPVSVGGGDEGPSPFQLLLASLGTCTCMTMEMYAARKKWPLRSVEVSLTFSKIPAADCAECETESGTVSLIEKEIHMDGDLDNQQLERLMEIADRCPVHRTLRSETIIRSRRL